MERQIERNEHFSGKHTFLGKNGQNSGTRLDAFSHQCYEFEVKII